jgi:hypothetical protein
MTIKTFTVDPTLGYAQLSETYGGQEININSSLELREILVWWREWGPVFRNMNISVQDSLQQTKLLHELSKEQNEIFPKSWTETTL